MKTEIVLFKPTLAELQQLFRDLSKLENDLRDAGGNSGKTCPHCGCSGQVPDSLKCDDCSADFVTIEQVRQHKVQVWRDMAERHNVAGPVEQLFYKIQIALTPEILNGLAGEILAIKCSRDEAGELMAEYQRRAEYFTANARAIRNN